MFTDNWGITWRMPVDNGRYYVCALILWQASSKRDLKFPWPTRLTTPSSRISLRGLPLWKSGATGLILNAFTSGILEWG